MSVCGGLGRLLCWVAEQLAEGRTKKKKKNRLFSHGSDSRVCALGHISELVGGIEDGAKAVPGLCACCLRSDAVRYEARGGQSHSMLA